MRFSWRGNYPADLPAGATSWSFHRRKGLHQHLELVFGDSLGNTGGALAQREKQKPIRIPAHLGRTGSLATSVCGPLPRRSDTSTLFLRGSSDGKFRFEFELAELGEATVLLVDLAGTLGPGFGELSTEEELLDFLAARMTILPPDISKGQGGKRRFLQRLESFLGVLGIQDGDGYGREVMTLLLFLEQVIGAKRTDGLDGGAVETGIPAGFQKLGTSQGFLPRVRSGGRQFLKKRHSFFQREKGKTRAT